MREILFRGKAINRDKGEHRTKYKNGDWVYGLLSRLYDERFECLPAEITNTDGISGIEIDYKTVGQYTGLTDKNDKKIFEGDILDCGDRVVFVKWHDYCGTWDCDFIKYKGERCSNGVTPAEWKYRAVIIGNIHDNLELLKGGE